MQGKYRSRRAYLATRGYRAILRQVIRPLVRWEPMDQPESGYSLILGCVSDLAEMVPGNLACLARQQLEHLRELIIVFDRPRDRMLVDVEPIIRERFPDLPCRFIYYNRAQYAASRTIRWGWLNAWLCWCLGIAAAKTRYVMLHDFDALLLEPSFIESRYRRMCRGDCEYLGVRYYETNGILTDDHLAVTIELMCDAAFIRRTFRPLDLFNHVTIHRGRSVDFDTLLAAQARAGRVAILESDPQDMVHPSQLICHFVAHQSGRGHCPPDINSLMLIPYYICVGGDDRLIRQATAALNESQDGCIPFFGQPLNVAALSLRHVAWLEELTGRVEKALFDGIRPHVREYLQALRLAHAVGQQESPDHTEAQPVRPPAG